MTNRAKHLCLRVFLAIAILLCRPAMAQLNALASEPPELFVDVDNQSGAETGSILQPFNTIQEGIAAAANGVNIRVAAGVYMENVIVQDKALQVWGGYPGGTPSGYASATPGDFSTHDPSTNVTEIRATAIDATVSFISAGASRIDGFRITQGRGSAYVAPTVAFGGGIFATLTEITIANNVIENNDTRGPDDPNLALGGGVFASGGTILIENNVIRNNFAGRGGGLAVSDGATVIRDNLIEDNVGVSDHGGGLYIVSPDVEITGNVIRGNEIGRPLGYGWGGGIIVFGGGSYVTIARMSFNRIHENFAPTFAGGVFIDDGAVATLRNELIFNNQCLEGNCQGGVGVTVDALDPQTPSRATLINCTIAINPPPPGDGPVGNGLLVLNSSATVRNCIVWGNGGDDFDTFEAGSITVGFTDSEESIAGAGNISADPLFTDPAGGDFHPRSTGGRFDPEGGGFVIDAEHSPAIDAGDPASDFSNETAPNGGRINMGAYGDTDQASRSAGGITSNRVPEWMDYE